MTKTEFNWDEFFGIANGIVDECSRQNVTWGEQNHPDGTNLTEDKWRSDRMKAINASFVSTNTLTWRDILLEEVYEAFAEDDPDLLIEELTQVAAVAISWIDAIKRRRSGQ